MKKQKQMQKAFGINEFGLVDFPVKISNVQVSRIVYGNERGCSRCFRRQATQQCLLTGNETGNAFEKQSGNLSVDCFGKFEDAQLT